MSTSILRKLSIPAAASVRVTLRRLHGPYGLLGLFGWLLALLLAASLPLQTVTSTLASVLGPRHVHHAAPAAADRADPMAGWRDFRRARYDHPSRASIDAGDDEAAAHAFAHATGQRHHHDAFDTTVQNVEMAGDDEGAAAATTTASVVFVLIAAGDSTPLPPPAEAMSSGWQTSRDERFSSADSRRLERPPQRSV